MTNGKMELAKMGRFLFVRATGWFISLIFSLVAASGQAAPALPGDPCQVEPRPVWSETEAWVWDQICVGEIADLNDHFNRDLDPRSPEGWTDERKLSSVFLGTILLYDPWRNAIPRQGVRISGAWFDGTIDLEQAIIAHRLWLDASRFVSDLNLSRTQAISTVSLQGSFINGTLGMNGTKIGTQINLAGAKVAGTLNLAAADVGQSLFMRSTPEERGEFNDVVLIGAKIGGQVNLAGVKVSGTLDMDSAVVGQNLLMHSTPEQRAEFKDVILGGATVGGQVNLAGVKVSGTLNMDSAVVGQILLMHSTPEQRAEFKDVILRGAKVGGQVALIGAEVTGALNMDSADIGQSLFMYSTPEQPAAFDGPVNLTFARIGSNLDVGGATLSNLDLTGAMIEGELRLASSTRWLPTWVTGGRLKLRNAKVDALRDEPEAWPAELDLDGFTYGRLGGLDPSVDVAARGSEWFVDWLARDHPFTPQPYEQLATVLREMGHGEEANDVLFAERERARKRAWGDGHWQSWIGQTFLKLTVGYGFGYRYFWALYWVAGLVLIATIVLGITGQNQRNDSKCIGIWYSLDMLLPIIQLRQAHYDIDLQGFARYYVYFHKIMGYVLASFLIAGVAGLTK